MTDTVKPNQDVCALLGHTEPEYTVRYGDDPNLLRQYQQYLHTIVDELISTGVLTFFAISQTGAPKWMAERVCEWRERAPSLGLRLYIVKTYEIPRDPYPGQQDYEDLADDIIIMDSDDYALHVYPLRLAGRAVIVEACPGSTLDALYAEQLGVKPLVYGLPAIIAKLSASEGARQPDR